MFIGFLACSGFRLYRVSRPYRAYRGLPGSRGAALAWSLGTGSGKGPLIPLLYAIQPKTPYFRTL